MPGTEAYFAAIVSEAKRATAKPLPKEAKVSAKVMRGVRVIRHASDKLVPQLCNRCGYRAMGHVWALTGVPVIVCANCSENAPADPLYSLREAFGTWAPATCA